MGRILSFFMGVFMSLTPCLTGHLPRASFSQQRPVESMPEMHARRVYLPAQVRTVWHMHCWLLWLRIWSENIWTIIVRRTNVKYL